MQFRLSKLTFSYRARTSVEFPAMASNRLRGLLGWHLKETDPAAYQSIFEPVRSRGPSGLADAPRPFVLRAEPLNGRTIQPGETFAFDVHLFDPSGQDAIHLAFGNLRGADLQTVSAEEIVIPLATSDPCEQITVRFLSPTELKADGKIAAIPDFAILASRARDRVSTLRAMYGEGPLEIDFQAFGERARQIVLTRYDTHHVDAERRSGRTGQTHSLSGFVGEAEYTGNLAEFLPVLRAAQWTGVGRQTPWGKGAIALKV